MLEQKKREDYFLKTYIKCCQMFSKTSSGPSRLTGRDLYIKTDTPVITALFTQIKCINIIKKLQAVGKVFPFTKDEILHCIICLADFVTRLFILWVSIVCRQHYNTLKMADEAVLAMSHRWTSRAWRHTVSTPVPPTDSLSKHQLSAPRRPADVYTRGHVWECDKFDIIWL